MNCRRLFPACAWLIEVSSREQCVRKLIKSSAVAVCPLQTPRSSSPLQLGLACIRYLSSSSELPCTHTWPWPCRPRPRACSSFSRSSLTLPEREVIHTHLSPTKPLERSWQPHPTVQGRRNSSIASSQPELTVSLVLSSTYCKSQWVYALFEVHYEI